MAKAVWKNSENSSKMVSTGFLNRFKLLNLCICTSTYIHLVFDTIALIDRWVQPGISIGSYWYSPRADMKWLHNPHSTRSHYWIQVGLSSVLMWLWLMKTSTQYQPIKPIKILVNVAMQVVLTGGQIFTQCYWGHPVEKYVNAANVTQQSFVSVAWVREGVKQNWEKAVRLTTVECGGGSPPLSLIASICENFDPFLSYKNGKITPNMATCREFS